MRWYQVYLVARGMSWPGLNQTGVSCHHAITRGRAGSNLLAQLLYSKYSLHLPLNRQSAVNVRKGIDLDVSTLAD